MSKYIDKKQRKSEKQNTSTGATVTTAAPKASNTETTSAQDNQLVALFQGLLQRSAPQSNTKYTVGRNGITRIPNNVSGTIGITQLLNAAPGSVAGRQIKPVAITAESEDETLKNHPELMTGNGMTGYKLADELNAYGHDVRGLGSINLLNIQDDALANLYKSVQDLTKRSGALNEIYAQDTMGSVYGPSLRDSDKELQKYRDIVGDGKRSAKEVRQQAFEDVMRGVRTYEDYADAFGRMIVSGNKEFIQEAAQLGMASQNDITEAMKPEEAKNQEEELKKYYSESGEWDDKTFEKFLNSRTPEQREKINNALMTGATVLVPFADGSAYNYFTEEVPLNEVLYGTGYTAAQKAQALQSYLGISNQDALNWKLSAGIVERPDTSALDEYKAGLSESDYDTRRFSDRYIEDKNEKSFGWKSASTGQYTGEDSAIKEFSDDFNAQYQRLEDLQEELYQAENTENPDWDEIARIEGEIEQQVQLLQTLNSTAQENAASALQDANTMQDALYGQKSLARFTGTALMQGFAGLSNAVTGIARRWIGTPVASVVRLFDKDYQGVLERYDDWFKNNVYYPLQEEGVKNVMRWGNTEDAQAAYDLLGNIAENSLFLIMGHMMNGNNANAGPEVLQQNEAQKAMSRGQFGAVQTGANFIAGQNGVVSEYRQIIADMLTDPMYIISFIQENENDYKEAIDSGASPLVAEMYALVTSFVNAGIEVGGGSGSGTGGIQSIGVDDDEGFFTQLADRLLHRDFGWVTRWLDGATEEGLEELKQGFVGNAARKMLLDHGLRWFSDEEGQDAVINIPQLKKETKMGALGGLVLGAGGEIVNNFAQRRIMDTTTGGNIISNNMAQALAGIAEDSAHIHNDTTAGIKNGTLNMNTVKGQRAIGKLWRDTYAKLDDGSKWALNNQLIRPVAAALEEAGYQGDAETAAAVIAKEYRGEELTKEEMEVLEDPTASQVEAQLFEGEFADEGEEGIKFDESDVKRNNYYQSQREDLNTIIRMPDIRNIDAKDSKNEGAKVEMKPVDTKFGTLGTAKAETTESTETSEAETGEENRTREEIQAEVDRLADEEDELFDAAKKAETLEEKQRLGKEAQAKHAELLNAVSELQKAGIREAHADENNAQETEKSAQSEEENAHDTVKSAQSEEENAQDTVKSAQGTDNSALSEDQQRLDQVEAESEQLMNEIANLEKQYKNTKSVSEKNRIRTEMNRKAFEISTKEELRNRIKDRMPRSVPATTTDTMAAEADFAVRANQAGQLHAQEDALRDQADATENEEERRRLIEKADALQKKREQIVAGIKKTADERAAQNRKSGTQANETDQVENTPNLASDITRDADTRIGGSGIVPDDEKGTETARVYGLSGRSYEELIQNLDDANVEYNIGEIGKAYERANTERRNRVRDREQQIRELNQGGKTKQRNGVVRSISAGEAKAFGVQTVHTSVSGEARARRNAAITAMRQIAGRLNMNIVLYESGVDANGNRTGANGWYDRSTDTVYIDMFAGYGNEQAILRTLAHELTHFIQNWSPEGYRQLQEFLTNYYHGRGKGTLAQLVQAQMDTAEKNGHKIDEVKAMDEVVADACEMMLSDPDAARTLVKENKTLAQKIKGWIDKLCNAIRTAMEGIDAHSREARLLMEMQDKWQKAQQLWYDALNEAAENRGGDYTTAKAEDIKNKSEANADIREISQSETTQYEMRDPAYQFEYMKTFKEQLYDYMDLGKRQRIFGRDALMVGSTPQVLQSIGLPVMPMTINQRHVRFALEGNYKRVQKYAAGHTYEIEEFAKLPDKIADPIAIIPDKSDPGCLVVLVEMTSKDGDLTYIPFKIDSQGRIQGQTYDSQRVASVYSKQDAIDMLRAAVEKDSDEKIRLFYLNKEKADQLLAGGTHTSAFKLPNGFVHNITDPGSPVKLRIQNQTQTKQFKDWFGDSRVTNNGKTLKEGGTPLVVYHGTDARFTVFDMDKGRSTMDIQGAFFSPQRNEAAEYGKNVGAFYLSIDKPAPADVAYNALRMFKGQNDAGRKARDYLISQGYNGVDYGGEEYIAFYPTQVKSASDNIGLFDKSNPDYRYSLRDTVPTPQQLGQAAKEEGFGPHTDMMQFSVRGVTEAAGLSYEIEENGTRRYILRDRNGNIVAPGSFTAEMVKGTPAGQLIDMGQRYAKNKIRAEADAHAQRKFIADIVNMIGEFQDAAMVWELAGSMAFSALKTNGDPQYSDSYDFGTICAKTQAILNTISETQLRLGRALTKEEIDGVVYEEVGKGVQDENGKWIHGATPCPVCYVYATWVNKPARLDLVRKFRDQYKNWTDGQIDNLMSYEAKQQPGETKSAYNERVTDLNRRKLWVSLCLAEEKTGKDGKKHWVRRANPELCPNEILLDLRRSGDMATKYPQTWLFMQRGGNAMGKAINEYADSRLGETIIGKAQGADALGEKLLTDEVNKETYGEGYVPKFVNPFLSGNQKAAEQIFRKALTNIKKQNLKGGQRWQSWSDFRAEWGSDYLMEMLTMQLLQSQVQTYTKVVEAVDLLASAGFEVNLSGMPHGDGFWHNEDGSIKRDRNGNPMLRFSPVTGINPDAALEYVRKYGSKGNVQFMTVGISDEHIRAALASDYVTFCIPFHGSGGSVRRVQHLMSLLREQMQTGNDYTNAQSDSFVEKNSKGENTNPNWALRTAILEGQYDKLTDDQKATIRKNEYLNRLYEERYEDKDSEAYGVFFSHDEAKQIYPYEYWDKHTTLETADVNSMRFIEYCQLLGVIPRFSGLTKTEGTGKNARTVEYANFSGARRDAAGNITGYDPVPGYWKLLIDRSMYNRAYDDKGNLIPSQSTYHTPQTVSVNDIDIGMMPKAANNTVGYADDDVRQISERIIQRIQMTSAQNDAAGDAFDTKGESEAKQITDNRDGVQYSDRDYAAALKADDDERMQEMVRSAAEAAMPDSAIRDEDGNLMIVYHGTSEQFTEFDMSKGRANMDIQGAFFSPWELDAEGYGTNVGAYYLNIKNPASEGVAYGALNRYKGQNEAGKKAREYLISKGYDGVNGEGMEFIAFYPEQIKSADAVTYDDNGNVIPLSKRFGDKSDFRYSERDPEYKTDRQILAEALEGAAANDEERQMLKDYKELASTLDQNEQLVRSLNEQIRNLRLEEQNNDAENRLIEERNRIQKAIDAADRKLYDMERMAPMRRIAKGERRKAENDLQKAKEHMERYRAGILRREAIGHIERTSRRLAKWLTAPAGKSSNYVPETLRRPLGEFLLTIDKMSAQRRAGGPMTEEDRKFANQLQQIEQMLRNIERSRNADTQDDIEEQYAGYVDLPMGFTDTLGSLVVRVRNRMTEAGANKNVLDQMTQEELDALDMSLTAISSSITHINEFLTDSFAKSVSETAQETIDEMREYKRQNNSLRGLQRAADFVQWDNVMPTYAFNRFGESGRRVFNALREGQDKLAFNAKRIIDLAEELYTAEEAQEWSKEIKEFIVNPGTGDTVRMTVAHLMSLYALSRRAQALGHLVGEGFRVTDFKEKNKTITDKGHVINEGMLHAMVNTLTERQRQVAESLVNTMSTLGSDWGNYVSMRRFGYKQFTEKYYFPIKSDTDLLPAKTDTSTGNELYKLLNMSMTKPLTQKANNRIMLENIFDVFASHMSDMALYNAMALPMLDAVKWLNYKSSEQEEGETAKYTDGVRDAIRDAFGTAAVKYITELFKDVNGGGNVNDTGVDLTQKMLSRYNRVAVAANLRVALLQPLAIIRAGNELPGTSLAKGTLKAIPRLKSEIQEMQEKSGIALWKSLGYRETNIGRSVKQQIQHMETLTDKISDKSMFLAELGDQVTWGAMWMASKEYIRKTQRDLVPGTDAYFEAVKQKFEDVIYNTQVVDSILTKSQLMRSSKTTNRMMSSFMSEPTTTFNTLMQAWDRMRLDMKKGKSFAEAWQKNGLSMGRTTLCFLIAAAVETAIAQIMSAYRDDDDYETFMEKVKDGWWQTLVDNMNPLTLLPGIKQIYEAGVKPLLGMETYDDQNVLTEGISTTVQGIQKIMEGKGTVWGRAYTLAKGASMTTGIPIHPVMREFQALWNNTVVQIQPNWRLETSKTQDSVGYNLLYQAYAAGDTERQEQLKERLLERGSDNDKITNAMNTRIKSDLKSGEITQEEAEKRIQDLTGKDANDAYFKTQQMLDSDFSKYSNLETAIKTGTGYKEAVSELTSHGVDPKDVQTKARSVISQMAIEDKLSESEIQKLFTQYGGMTADEAYIRSQELRYQQLTGTQTTSDAAMVFYAIDNKTSPKAAIDGLTKHGKEAKSIASSITSKYKQQYLDLISQGKKSEAAALKGRLITVFDYLGYDGSKKIEDWEKPAKSK